MAEEDQPSGTQTWESEEKRFSKSSAPHGGTASTNPTGRLLSGLAQPLAFEHAVLT